MKIGIIGYGFVGQAVANAHDTNQLLINDPIKLGNDSVSIDQLKAETDWIYVCVPTPANEDGSNNTDILTSVFESINGYEGYVISKCTALPSFYAQAKESYTFKLVHMPEFLTAANANNDYLNPELIVIGASTEESVFVYDNIIKADKVNKEYATIISTDIASASAMKYYANSFLANKIIFNNQFKVWAESQGATWKDVTDILELDSRLGNSHFSVPGSDGIPGYGGYCFPKDVDAVIASAKQSNISVSLIEHQRDVNNQLRQKD
jgi:UDPglucose 6-dehydrogenase